MLLIAVLCCAQMDESLLDLEVLDLRNGLRERHKDHQQTASTHFCDASMVSTPSLPSAAHQIAESIFLSDEDAREFLQRFPLVQMLECASAPPRSGCVSMLLTHIRNYSLCCPDQSRLCRTLQRGSLSQQSSDYVCAALKKVFSTAFGRRAYL